MIPPSGTAWEPWDIEADPDGWDARVAPGEIFQRSRVLALHAPRRTRLLGWHIPRREGPALALGGILDPGAARFELLGLPAGSFRERHLLTDLCRALGSRGVREVRFGSFDGGVEEHPRLPAGSRQERLEFVVDVPALLSQGPGGLRSGHRRHLRRLQGSRLRLRHDPARCAGPLTRLRLQWLRRRRGRTAALRGCVPLWLYHRKLERTLGGTLGHLYVIERGGRSLSAAYMLEHGDRAFYMIGASSTEGYRQAASIALFWHLFVEYGRRGIRTVNLGGVPAAAREPGHPEHGVLRFKRGFNAREIRRVSLHVPLGGS